jgi:hypothetical protein
VHLWYVTLSLRLVEFQAEMAWTGRSWVLSPLLGNAVTRSLAAVLYVLSTLGFVIAGIGLFAGGAWWRPLLIGSAAFSAVVILLFWDGGTQMIVEKGLLGFLINLAILVSLLIFNAAWLA